MSTIAANIHAVQARIATAAHKVGRAAADVTLLAVSKTFAAQAVAEAAASGQRDFGENYIQEAVEKINQLRNTPGLVWHCIGPIQSNKTRLVAEHFDWVHTVDRLKTAERLSAQRPSSAAPLQVCVQVNVAPVANKSGVAADDAAALCAAVAAVPALELRGLMCIPDPVLHPDGRLDLAAMQDLFGQVTALHTRLKHRFGPRFDTLSMGMSADMESAIAAGSTLVRVGTAVFGSRT